MPRVFDKFFRAARPRVRGSGLGLTVAKGLVEAHGGRDLGGVDARARRRLPFPVAAGVVSSPGARILVVDDEPEILRWLGTSLGHRGFDVVAADSGEEALEHFARRRPDLIVLDLGLPGMDGLEVIRRVRTEAPTPIVVLSVQRRRVRRRSRRSTSAPTIT